MSVDIQEAPVVLGGASRRAERSALASQALPSKQVELASVTRAIAWFSDAALLGFVLSGGMVFDARLALFDNWSGNQILGITTLVLLVLRLRLCGAARLLPTCTLTVVGTLLLLLLLGSFDSPNQSYAEFKLVSYGGMVVPMLLHLEWTVRDASDARRWLWLAVLAAAALVLLSLPHMVSMQVGQRLAVLGGGPNTLARQIGTGLIALAALLGWRRRAPWQALAITVGVLVACVALVLTGTKAVMLSLPVTIMFVLGRRQRIQHVRLVGAGILMLLLVPLVAHDLVSDLPKDGALVRVLRLPDFDDPLGSYGSRLRYLIGSWQEWRSSPWFGVGTGGWGMQLDLGFSEAYPHNLLLEVLSELGVVGLALPLFAALLAARRAGAFPAASAVAGGGTSALRLGLSGMVLFWGLNVQLSGDLVDSRYFWLWLAIWELHRRRAASAPDRMAS